MKIKTLLSKNVTKAGTSLLASALVFAFSFPINQMTFNDKAYADPSIQSQVETAMSTLESLKSQLGVAEDDYNQALMDQQAAKNKMDEAQNKIDECSEKISKVQEQLGNRAKSMYRSGSSTLIDLIFGATSFQSLATNWDLLNSMNAKDGTMVAESKSLREELDSQKRTFEQQEKIAAEKTAEAEKVMNNANQLVQNQQAVYDKLSADAANMLAQQQAAQEQAAQQQVINDINNGNGGGNNSGGGNVNNNKPQTVTGNVVVDRAYSQIGKPYVWGGVGPNGFDCSGLVSYCLSGRNARLGTTYTFLGWTRVSSPQPGDVCVNSGHAGIYIGNGQMIHAPQPGQTVCVGSVQAGMIFVRY